MNNIFLAGVTEPFGRNHLISLAVSIVVIILALIVIKKKNVSFNVVTNIMLIVWVISEFLVFYCGISYLLSDGSIVKIIDYQQVEGIEIVRAFYPRSELPFHLCSIQPIFILIIKFTKNVKLKDTLLSFIFPTGTLGALIALIVSTVGGDFAYPRFWEYFLFHTTLIIYSISIVLTKQIKINLKSHFRTCLVLVLIFYVSIWINALCSDTSLSHVINGVEDSDIYTNFFFALKPPLENMPILNFNHGWWGYILAVVVIGISGITLLHLPFIIINERKAHLEKQD